MKPSTARGVVYSGLFAAIVMTALVWHVARKDGDASAYPTSVTGQVEPTVDTGRLMAPEEPGTSLFLDAEHDLLLKYPSAIVPIRNRAEMEALGYIPVCDPAHALVCFPYAPPELAGTTFGNAAFSIHLRGDIETEAECLAVQPAETAHGAVMLGETVFSSFAFADAAMSHRLDGWNYRSFRNGNCYELATRITSTVYEVYEPGTIREFTEEDQASVRAALDAILKSFRFQEDQELI